MFNLHQNQGLICDLANTLLLLHLNTLLTDVDQRFPSLSRSSSLFIAYHNWLGSCKVRRQLPYFRNTIFLFKVCFLILESRNQN